MAKFDFASVLNAGICHGRIYNRKLKLLLISTVSASRIQEGVGALVMKSDPEAISEALEFFYHRTIEFVTCAHKQPIRCDPYMLFALPRGKYSLCYLLVVLY